MLGLRNLKELQVCAAFPALYKSSLGATKYLILHTKLQPPEMQSIIRSFSTSTARRAMAIVFSQRTAYSMRPELEEAIRREIGAELHEMGLWDHPEYVRGTAITRYPMALSFIGQPFLFYFSFIGPLASTEAVPTRMRPGTLPLIYMTMMQS